MANIVETADSFLDPFLDPSSSSSSSSSSSLDPFFGFFDLGTFVGYFGFVFLICCIVFWVLMLFLDFYMNYFRQRSRVLVRKKEKKEKKERKEREKDERGGKRKGELPGILPYEDYLLSVGRFLKLVLTGDQRARDSAYLHERNMEHDKKNDNLMCRQAVFGIFPGIFTWDPDHYRLITQEPGPFKKMTGISKFFQSISERSILFVEGEEWQDQHRLIHPAFSISHLYDQVPKFNFVGHRLVGQLRKVCDQPIEVVPWMSKATLDGLSIAGFGIDMEALIGGHSEGYKIYTTAMKGFEDPLRMIPFIEDLPTQSNKIFRDNFRKYMNFLEEIVEEKRVKLRERRERGGEEEEEEGVFGEGKDILDILVGACDVDGGNGLTKKELIHNVNIFFIAGHETSSSTLAFCLHVLEQYPEYQRKIKEEIAQIIGKNDPTAEQIKQLKLLPCFIKEVMRIYPAAPGLIRVAHEDCVMGNYQVTKGDLVMFCTFSTQRHPQLWDDPDRFWPERFYVENSKGRHPFAYIPFSAGSRACIGNNFALIEMKILLIHILQNFEVLTDHKTPVPFESYAGITLRPIRGTTLLLKPISS